jgi:hypothetical protein
MSPIPSISSGTTAFPNSQPPPASPTLMREWEAHDAVYTWATASEAIAGWAGSRGSGLPQAQQTAQALGPLLDQPP